jgi:plastocyanin
MGKNTEAWVRSRKPLHTPSGPKPAVVPGFVAVLLLACLPLGGSAQRVDVSGTITNGGPSGVEATLFLVPTGGAPANEVGSSVTIDQVHLRFVPRTLAVTPGTPVRFLNSDPLLHNIFSPGPEGFDLGTRPQDEAATHTFESEGVHVVLCNIHPEMVAYVMVVPSAHKTVVGPDGSFLLPDVPPGRYDLHVWSVRRSGRFSMPLQVGPTGSRGVDLMLSDRGLSRR